MESETIHKVHLKISQHSLQSAFRAILTLFPVCLIYSSIVFYNASYYAMQVSFVTATYWALLGVFLFAVDFNLLPALNEWIKVNAAFVFTFGGRALLHLLCGFTMVIYVARDTASINGCGVVVLITALILLMLARSSIKFPYPLEENIFNKNRLMTAKSVTNV